jgi:hypothetical protein
LSSEIRDLNTDAADEEPVQAGGKAPRQFEFVVGKRFRVQRALVALVEAYSERSIIRSTSIQAAVLGVICIAALVIFGRIVLVAALIGVVCAAVVLVVQPVRFFVLLLRVDKFPIHPGSTYAAIYGVKSFRVRLPSGDVQRYLYSEIAGVHARGRFVLFALPRQEARVILPLGVVPHGDVSWLQERERGAAPITQ